MLHRHSFDQSRPASSTLALPAESIRFPLFNPARHRDVKDPCPVFDGRCWHIFGSAGSVVTETWGVFHATADQLEGPWTEQPVIFLPLDGSGVAAPGVAFEDGCFHMFIQTEFMKPNGTVEYFTSRDGFDWTHAGTPLVSIAGSDEHGIYDPHPAVIGGRRYLAYSAMPPFDRAPQPDVYLAVSETGSWAGPYAKLGKILDHTDIEEHHNQRGHHDYEWGIEGAQVLELPDGKVLLNATCFLPDGPRGRRQRVFLAVADQVEGPYRSLGPCIDPEGLGENGHSTAILQDGCMVLFFQSRLETTDHRWRYGMARFPLTPAQAQSDAGPVAEKVLESA